MVQQAWEVDQYTVYYSQETDECWCSPGFLSSLFIQSDTSLYDSATYIRGQQCGSAIKALDAKSDDLSCRFVNIYVPWCVAEVFLILPSFHGPEVP
ncbi:hypothetical protein STEG23_010280 [Scotinomys teguina]